MKNSLTASKWISTYIQAHIEPPSIPLSKSYRKEECKNKILKLKIQINPSSPFSKT